MTNPATVRPLTAAEIGHFARRYANIGLVNDIIRDTRQLYPDATGIAFDWSSEYDDEGGTYKSTDAIYVLFADGKYHRIGWSEVFDQNDVEIEELPAGVASVDSLREELGVEIDDLIPLAQEADGPGEINLSFARLEKEYLTDLPTLYVAVTQ